MVVHISETVLGLTGLLAIAVLLLPVARRLNFPYTVLLAAVGCIFGLALEVSQSLPGFIGDFLQAVERMEITAETVLFIFLPALVFESALAIDVRRLMDDIAPILMLAVLGLLISAAIVGFSMHWMTGAGLVVCLLLGAIVSATDPVAVVAIFKDLGAPKRLGILVEGESLFNDATAIVLFTILAGMLTSGEEVGVLQGIWQFLLVFLGGVLVGYIMARLLCLVLPKLGDVPLVKVTLTISLAYLSFVVAEHYLHVSGVMATVSAALVMGSVGRTSISPETWHSLSETWEVIGFWANSLIFILVGVVVPSLLAEAGWQELVWLLVLIGAAFAARALIIYGIVPMFSRLRLAANVSLAYRSVMFWGGLRGAVSLALALAVLENPKFPAEVQNFVAMMVTGFVLFTLFVNAPTMPMLMSLLGLDKLSIADEAIRNRVMALSLTHIRNKLAKAAAGQNVSADLTDEALAVYDRRLQSAEQGMEDLQGIDREEWVRVGLTALLGRERKLVMNHYATGVTSPNVTRQRLGHIENVLDGVKAHGIEGYQRSVRRNLSFPRQFKLALLLQRRFGHVRYLARLLADRFEFLAAAKMVVGQLQEHSLPQMAPILGKEASDGLTELLEQRAQMIDEAVDSLHRQYPEYARTLEKRYLERVALRLESKDFDTMLADSVISQEVYNRLSDSLGDRRTALDQRPRLDLGLEPERLVSKVPFFADLGEERICQIVRLLKPSLCLPDEAVIEKGDDGHAMYFISSGSAAVELGEQRILLGSGDFFGEMALIDHAPRKATVRAVGFCELLVLYVNDFNRLLQENPDIKSAIEAVAEQRR